MKYNIKSLIILFSFFLGSCQDGILILTSGYLYNVIVHSYYEYNNTILESFDEFHPGMSFAVASRGHIEYRNIIALQIKTQEGELLADYPPDYLNLLRNAYKNKNKQELWVFTEKGLFLEMKEISKRYNSKDERSKYYNSDEAVMDLEKLLASMSEN